jgi:hypothetical protein
MCWERRVLKKSNVATNYPITQGPKTKRTTALNIRQSYIPSQKVPWLNVASQNIPSQTRLPDRNWVQWQNFLFSCERGATKSHFWQRGVMYCGCLAPWDFSRVGRLVMWDFCVWDVLCWDISFETFVMGHYVLRHCVVGCFVCAQSSILKKSPNSSRPWSK